MRVGIVGSGIRGQMYARALSSVDDVDVVGLCDLSPLARKSAEAVFDGPVLHDHTELYALGMDAVIIATPDFAHLDSTIDAAAAGMDLMVEKPLATNSIDADRMADVVRTSGVSCLVAFENRWNPHFLKVRSMIERGDLGEITSISGVLSNTYFVPEEMLSWSAKSSPGWFLMPHTLDLAMWLSGAAPTTVLAKGHYGLLSDRGIPTWDSVDAIVELDNGAIANLRSSWVLPSSSPHIVDFRVEVIGTRGSARIDMNDQGLHTNIDRHASHWSLPVDIDGDSRGMAQWMVQSWAKNLITGKPVGPDADHGAIVTRTIENIHTAISGRKLPLASC